MEKEKTLEPPRNNATANGTLEPPEPTLLRTEAPDLVETTPLPGGDNLSNLSTIPTYVIGTTPPPTPTPTYPGLTHAELRNFTANYFGNPEDCADSVFENLTLLQNSNTTAETCGYGGTSGDRHGDAQACNKHYVRISAPNFVNPEHLLWFRIRCAVNDIGLCTSHAGTVCSDTNWTDGLTGVYRPLPGPLRDLASLANEEKKRLEEASNEVRVSRTSFVDTAVSGRPIHGGARGLNALEEITDQNCGGLPCGIRGCGHDN